MRLMILAISLIILSSCGTQYIRPQLPLPAPLIDPKITNIACPEEITKRYEFIACFTKGNYKKLVLRDSQKTARIKTLRNTIKNR